jgi:cell division septal protein FtsQ
MRWFKRNPKNRRLAREYVLDVKLRSSQIRATRARLAVLAVAIVFGGVLGAYFAWLGGRWAVNQLVYENRAFAIEELDVQTDGVIAIEQIRRWAGVRPGENLLALDLGRVQRDLRLISSIESVSVERVPPRTLRIRVHERDPIAQVNTLRAGATSAVEKVIFHLDAEGYVIVPLVPQQRAAPATSNFDQLPLVTGINPNDILAGRKIDQPQVQAALELLVAFEHSPMQGLADVKSVDVSAPEVLEVLTAQGTHVTFPLRDLEQQLRRWQSVFLLAQRNNKLIASLDLAVTNSIPVTFQEPTGLPTPPPKPPKQLKRKHV